MAEQTALMVEGLRKSYGAVQAVRGITLEVRLGEIFGFLGPNGAGKTTTIRCALDLIHPDAGTIRVLGMDPRQRQVEVRSRTGYLPGELRMYDNLSVEGQLRYLNDLRGRRADWGFVRQLASRLDLDLERPIKNLSKGNKQKVGVIQALMHRPELLILDEPTAGLDPLMQREVLGLIRAARTDGATVFLSSHILSEVEVIAGRVGIIRNGTIVDVADPQSLVQRALHRVTIRFKLPVNAAGLATVPGVTDMSADQGQTVTLHVTGDMDPLIKALGTYPVLELEASRPSLEEAFLAYYKTEQAPEGANKEVK